MSRIAPPLTHINCKPATLLLLTFGIVSVSPYQTVLQTQRVVNAELAAVVMIGQAQELGVEDIFQLFHLLAEVWGFQLAALEHQQAQKKR